MKGDFKNNVKLIFSISIVIISIILFLNTVILPENESFLYSYNIDENVDYKVYINSNEFISPKYIGEEELYIAELIDYINVDFRYNFDASTLENINYTYDIIATLYIDYSNNNRNLVTKEYPIIENKFLELNNQNKIKINESINIDYKTYNNEVLNFKNRFNLPITAYLKVQFKIKTGINLAGKEETLYKDSTASIDIELNQPVFAITEKYMGEENKTLLETEKYASEVNLYALLLSAIMFLFSSIYLIKKLLKVETKTTKINEIKLNRILKKYSDIIIELEEEFYVKNATEILVKNFEELVDVEDEIREPILFFKDKEGNGIFLIINQGLVYKYILAK